MSVSLNGELQTVLISVLAYIGLLTPVAYAAVRAWLLAHTNSTRLDNIPSNGELEDKINAAIQAHIANNGNSDTVT